MTLPSPHSTNGPLRWTGVVLALLVASVSGVAAQTPLHMADRDTEVRAVSFRFVDTQSFDTDRLKQQIATRAPTFVERLRRRAPLFTAERQLLDPIELQRDVARLRKFYQENGFLSPRIDYPASQLDSLSNSIHVIFTIEEGDPVIIQDANFFSPDGQYAVSEFTGEQRERWIAFRISLGLRLGERYTDFNRRQIEDDIRRWLRNEGYAFAQVSSGSEVDSEFNTADLRFEVDPGPRTYISEIDIEGLESVDRSVVLRELPFREGDRFSQDKLTEGQQRLFRLNLFRVALVDVPSQPRADSARVRVRVREGRVRSVSAETGYGTDVGLTGEGRWRHRNFLGGARSLTVGLLTETGLLAEPGLISAPRASTIPPRRFRGQVTLRQPHLFMPRLTGTIEPFVEFRRNARLQPPSADDDFLGLGINARDIGLNTRLNYEVLPFRNISLEYSLSRSLQFTEVDDPVKNDDVVVDPIDGPTTETDQFNKSVLTLSGRLGRVDDFLNPTDGFQTRPTVEVGLPAYSDVQYVKLSNELSGYLPIGDDMELAGRLNVGRLWPYDESRRGLDAGERRFENRFDDIFFYAGGSSDVRGWRPELAGTKEARPLVVDREVAGSIERDTVNFIFDPVGGTAKLAGNVEMRLPFPGLGSDWRTAVFLDAGQVRRDGTLTPSSDMRFGTGTGIRYRTPVGYLRLDVAYKLNPSPNDMRNPREVFEWQEGLRDTPPSTSFIRRFRIHIGIGQSF